MTGASVPNDLSRHQFIDVPLGAARLAEAMRLKRRRRLAEHGWAGLGP